MEGISQSSILEGEIVGIRFGLASHKEVCTASVSDCSISHSSQLSNPFLGLPLEFGKCESCGTSEPGKCEGHFGYIELPIPIYHPSHVIELKHVLSLLCLKCLKLKKNKIQVKSNGVAQRLLSCCEECSQVSVQDVKTTDGASFLQLKLPSKSRLRDGAWNFLESYGFRYGDSHKRTLLPCEVLQILKKIPADSRKRLSQKGYFPQDGFIISYLPVPPNCLSVPDISDGVSIMSSDLSISMLKKVLKQVDIIKNSRSGMPNFEAHEVEANDLQVAVNRYLQVRGTTKVARDAEPRYGVKREDNESSTKAWLEKMRTLFIRKGCGFSSRSVITGDSYKQVNEIGIPYEIAQKITFEERVSNHNKEYLQKLVDDKLCLTYRDGSSTYSLREGSKGHTFLRLGQVVHRRIMDGDIVFINRPPTTHKHSLQALSVYVHEDHTVKINPLICGPLSADFDGDCIHLFYPQSLAAKAEVLELFSVEKQLLSSHSGYLNLQLTKDSLLSLKMIFKEYLLNRPAVQQLAMFASSLLPPPALLKVHQFGPYWTALQVLQTTLPTHFKCSGDKFLIGKSEMLRVDYNRDLVQSMMNEILISIFFDKGSGAVLKFFNLLQPLLMENLYSEGFSVSLKDFVMPRAAKYVIDEKLKSVSPLLHNLRSIYNELVELQLEEDIWHAKQPVVRFIWSSSSLGDLIDSRGDSAITKIVQQIGFLGLQISDRGKLYSNTLVDDIAWHFEKKYPNVADYPSARYGLIRSCFIHGLDPYEEIVHSISTREVICRSSRGLSEPGTLFKNLMAILRDVVVCYDGTVRNVCSNSVIQFNYGVNVGSKSQSLFPAGEPVGVLAATAMSNPAYKAVLDSTPSSNSSWELMKEILLCKASFKNDQADRRVILYLKNCSCGRKYCQEKAAYLVKSHLEKISLKDVVESFMIEYKRDQSVLESYGVNGGLIGHVHLKKIKLEELHIGIEVILQKCQEKMSSYQKMKKSNHIFKRTSLSISGCCSFQQPCANESPGMPCLMFSFQDTNESHFEKTIDILADVIYPVLVETVIKGDGRISSANIIWTSPETTTWIRNPSRNLKGELALDVILGKSAVKQSGDAWRIVLDSCLPVLHLIDTTRSIPYAIKQVQELLGVSCAFDQAVQRLSTSVTMVAKGVLKEHLILLANSMTCAGDLVGFNPSGYKALSRALNIQVPFAEATLFTPRKCFEKAAEKCHVDALSSIVASCAWGKNVAVGTGSRFDILWDTKQENFDQAGNIDVYNFLGMLRSTKDGGEPASACLGEEVDALMLEDELDDWTLSPEHNSSDKPTFEYEAEFQHFFGNQPDQSNWEKVSISSDRSKMDGNWNSSNQWDTKAAWNAKQNLENSEAEPNSWSGWGSNKTKRYDILSSKSKEEFAMSSDEKVPSSSGGPGKDGNWELSSGCAQDHRMSDWVSSFAMEATAKSSGWNDSSRSHEVTTKSSGWNNSRSQGAELSSSSWNAASARTSSHLEANTKSSGWNASSAWDSGAAQDATAGSGGWNVNGSSRSQEVTTKSSGWKDSSRSQGADLNSGSWNAASAQTSTNPEANPKTSGWNASSAWDSGTAQDAAARSGGWNGNGSSRSQEDTTKSSEWKESSRSQGADNNSGSWDAASARTSSNPGANPKSSGWNGSSAWNSGTAQDATGRSGGWNGNGSSRTQEDMTKSSGWKDTSRSQGAALNSGSWNAASAQTSADPEANPKSSGWNASSENSGAVRDATAGSGGWNGNGSSRSQEDTTKSSGWKDCSRSQGADLNSGSWNAASAQTSTDPEANLKSSGWNASAPSVSRGWGSNGGEWRIRKNRPPKPAGSTNDSSMSGLYTMTRQRLDIFTSEEQDLLSCVESLMQSIRRIMHNSGYNDGDPLSADDQKYILDNVLNYHPDKGVKMGDGIDHLTVSKHSDFQESRCFYVVSTDGSRQDFSYRKCLESYIKGRYPDLAEEFIGKYFARSRFGAKRQRSPFPAEEGTRDGNSNLQETNSSQ